MLKSDFKEGGRERGAVQLSFATEYTAKEQYYIARRVIEPL